MVQGLRGSGSRLMALSDVSGLLHPKSSKHSAATCLHSAR